MNRTQGKKLGIKFDVPLFNDTVDVAGFNVHGNVRKHVDGELIDTIFPVESASIKDWQTMWYSDFCNPRSTYRAEGSAHDGVCRLTTIDGGVYAPDGWVTLQPVIMGALPHDLKIEFVTHVAGIGNAEVQTAFTDDDVLPDEVAWVAQTNGTLITNVPEGALTTKRMWVRAYLIRDSESLTTECEWVKISKEVTAKTVVELIFPDLGRFNDIEGDLTIEYDQVAGNLRGQTTAVASFTQVLTPVALIPIPNPWPRETMQATPSVDIDWHLISKPSNDSHEETIQATPSIGIAYYHIDDAPV